MEFVCMVQNTAAGGRATYKTYIIFGKWLSHLFRDVMSSNNNEHTANPFLLYEGQKTKWKKKSNNKSIFLEAIRSKFSEFMN